MNVLFVDDEPNTREVYGRLFELAGHRVVTADSAATAARAIDTDDFDVAVIDVVLGDADGFSVLAYLRSHRPRTRAILVSAFEQSTFSDRPGLTSAEAFLAKPLRWTDLQSVLQAPGSTTP